MRITISGPPGSGKTTACGKLSEALGLEAVGFGRIFRDLAAEKQLTLSQLGEIAEQDPAIDNMIDGRILEIAKTHEDLILESRLSAYMLDRNGIDAFKIYIDASPEVRMARVGIREGETIEDATKATVDRQRSEAKRYQLWYGIDIGDLSVYDLVINTDDKTPDQVLDIILEGVRARYGDSGSRCDPGQMGQTPQRSYPGGASPRRHHHSGQAFRPHLPPGHRLGQGCAPYG